VAPESGGGGRIRSEDFTLTEHPDDQPAAVSHSNGITGLIARTRTVTFGAALSRWPIAAAVKPPVPPRQTRVGPTLGTGLLRRPLDADGSSPAPC
jgi:hypothetical protein